jgi:hypothetical protein
MRSYLIAAIATAALILMAPVSAKAQIVIGGYPSYTPRYYVPFSPSPRFVTPVRTQVMPVTGGPVEVALNTGLSTLGSIGYGPYAPYYGFAAPANYGPWTAFRPFNPPAGNWKSVIPRTSNPGWNKGGLKGFGKRR